MSVLKKYYSTSILSSFRESSITFAFFSALLVVLLLLFIFSMFNRYIHIDEAILGEQIFWILKEGTVRSFMYAGIGTGLEDKLLVYHKLFIWLGAGIAYLFGISLHSLRFVSLIFSILLCYSLYRFYRNQLELPKPELRQTFLLTLIFLFSNHLFFAFSYFYRPEIMQACLGFISFSLLYTFFKNEKLYYVALAAILASMAALTHLNGLIFISAGFMLLLVKKAYKEAFLFGFVAALSFLVYFADMLNPGEIKSYLYQFSGAPAFQKSDLHPLNRFFRIMDEHKRYFHSHIEGAFTLLLIVIGAFSFRHLWRRNQLLIVYTSFAALSLAIINQGQTSKYALLLIPFASILMADGFRSILLDKPKFSKWAFSAFIVYLFLQLHSIYTMIYQPIDLVSRNEAISKHIPRGSRVYAPVIFFFNQFEHYELRSYQSYITLVHRMGQLDLSQKDFFEHTRTMGSDYVVLDLLYMKGVLKERLVKNDSFMVGENYFGYQITQSQDNYVIFKRMDQ